MSAIKKRLNRLLEIQFSALSYYFSGSLNSCLVERLKIATKLTNNQQRQGNFRFSLSLSRKSNGRQNVVESAVRVRPNEPRKERDFLYVQKMLCVIGNIAEERVNYSFDDIPSTLSTFNIEINFNFRHHPHSSNC